MEQGGIYGQREGNHLQKADRSESVVRPSKKTSVAQSGGTRKPVGEEWAFGDGGEDKIRGWASRSLISSPVKRRASFVPSTVLGTGDTWSVRQTSSVSTKLTL